jgi:apolipoprotein D and lipocalin family protein
MLRYSLLLALACAPATESDSGSDNSSAEMEGGELFLPYSDDGLTVAQVEPARYLGLWYEIATSPSQQQQWCTGTTAEYSLIDEETIGVLNRCYVGSLDGNLNQIEGTARPIDDTYARLLVDLGVGFEAPYQIVELDGSTGEEPYAYAAVSSMGSQTWILARSPELDPEIRDEIWTRLDERGIDISELIDTEHGESID